MIYVIRIRNKAVRHEMGTTFRGTFLVVLDVSEIESDGDEDMLYKDSIRAVERKRKRVPDRQPPNEPYALKHGSVFEKQVILSCLPTRS